MRSIGSRSFYSAATVDNAPVLVAAELVAGNAMLNPVWDPAQPGLLILVGTNPVVSHGYGTALPDPVRHLREYRARGGRVWVIDPRRTETAALADEHLAVRPGSDVAVLAALASAMLEDGVDDTELCSDDDLGALRRALEAFTVTRAAATADVEERAIEELVRDIRSHPGRLAVMCGTGTTMSTDGILVEWLRWVLLVLSGSLDRPGGMRFNRGVINRLRPRRPDRPAPRLAARDREPPGAAAGRGTGAGGGARRRDRKRSAPCARHHRREPDHRVSGAGSRASSPSGARAARRRRRDGERAHGPRDARPPRDRPARADGPLDRGAHRRPFRVAVDRCRSGPRGDRRPVWWMLAALARNLGGDLLGGADPDSMSEEMFLAGLLAPSPLDAPDVFAAGPRGLDMPHDYGWVRESMLPDGRWQIAPPVLLARLATHRAAAPGLVLTPRREMAWSNSVRYAGTGQEPVVRMHPDDLAGAGLRDGERASVESLNGAISATVMADPKVRTGVVSVTHGHADARADQSPGRLTSSRDGVDPLTTMPQASGVPVTVTPSPQAPKRSARHG